MTSNAPQEHGAGPGAVLHVPSGSGRTVWFSGDVYTVALTAEQTGGSLGLIHASVPPGGGPPQHFHAEHEEYFCILDGELEFSEGARRFTARRGDVVMHNFHNTGLLPVSMLFLYTPGGPEGLFIEGGDEPVAGVQVQPWGPERIDDRLLGLLARYDNNLPPGAPVAAP